MKRVILAFQLLTRLPIRRQIQADARMYAGAAAFYPLAGLAVGVISALAYLMGFWLVFRSGAYAFSAAIGALIAVIAMFAVTGGLHLDGLADSFDGLLSSRTPERMLEIMKDSRMGAMGGIALMLDIAARLMFIAAMQGTWKAVLALTVAPIAAKTGIASAAWVSPYARKEGLGQSVTEHTRFGIVFANFVIALILAAILAAVCSPKPFSASGFGVSADGLIPGASVWLAMVPVVFAPVLALIIGVILSKLAAKRLGGITGDILGAVNEICEVSVMLLILAWR